MPMKLIDMRKTAEEKAEECSPMTLGNVNEYPFGLCLRLTESELDRLSVDADSIEVGEIYDMRAMVRVTSVSCNETEDGERRCVEAQIVMMGVESEDSEDQEPVKKPARIRYKE